MNKEQIGEVLVEDVIEFNPLEGVIDTREMANNCGGNCNGCNQPTCKQTCRTCRRNP